MDSSTLKMPFSHKVFDLEIKYIYFADSDSDSLYFHSDPKGNGIRCSRDVLSTTSLFNYILYCSRFESVTKQPNPLMRSTGRRHNYKGSHRLQTRLYCRQWRQTWRPLASLQRPKLNSNHHILKFWTICVSNQFKCFQLSLIVWKCIEICFH